MFVVPAALSDKSPSGVYVQMPLLRNLNLKGNPCSPGEGSDDESESGDEGDDDDDDEEGST